MADDTRELITTAVFSRWLASGALILLAAAVIAGAAWGRRKRAVGAGTLRGAVVGLTGPIALAMWNLYNKIEDRYGLDSVRALLINLGLFVAVGAASGLVLRWTWRRTDSRFAAAPETTGDTEGG